MSITLNAQQIAACLPHQYPFLLIDKVVDLVAQKSIIAIKNITLNEPWCTGHFPGNAIYPGVLIIESMAQSCGVLAFNSTLKEETDHKSLLLTSVSKASFKRKVVPGDSLVIKTEVEKIHGYFWSFICKSYVDDELAASARIMCTVEK